MKLGIISDTHDNMLAIARAVELFNAEKVALVIHAGDFISPITANEFGKLRAPFAAVFGNNDGDRLYLVERFKEIGRIYPDYHEFEFAGRRAVVMHEPKFIDSLIKSGDYGLLVYGHTHEIDIRVGETLVVNPGEACGWLTGKSTVVLLDSEDMTPRLVEL
ncbi:MAG TPA: metallophosphoesterase [Candidatus Acetothermia bacterium]|nr:metallophosphoesterase [Candidatus Acetothermia bacterium]